MGPIAIAQFTLSTHTAAPEALLAFTKVRIFDAEGVQLNITPKNTTFEIRP